MGISLGANQYGKSQTRVVRVYRDTPRHEIVDLNVSTSLHGEFADAHTRGDQANVVPTDTQKNTAFAFAKSHGVTSPEDYAVALATHFVDDIDSVRQARVAVDQYAWDRIPVGGTGHDHSFVRRGDGVRTTTVVVTGAGSGRTIRVVSGLSDLTILKSTGSQFTGYLKDDYTTLPEADDRILATSLIAKWRYDTARYDTAHYDTSTATGLDWTKLYDTIRATMLETFAETYSHALQETLFLMGKRVLETVGEVAEIKLSAPNKHHFLVDLEQFGIANDNEVFFAADRPYGLIEASAVRDEASPDEDLWHQLAPFV